MAKDSPEHHHSPLIKLLAVLYFGGSSMFVQYTTKSIFTNYGFNYPLTVAMLQMAFISPVTYLIVRPPLSPKLAFTLAPLALVNVLNVVTGLMGTGGLTIPMFIALRRFTLVFTIVIERFYLGKSHEWETLAAVSIMVVGALVAAATDLSFNAWGYFAVLCNDIFTSLYLSMVKNVPTGGVLTTTGMLFYNSTLSLPMLLLAVLYTGEPWKIATSLPRLNDTNFHIMLLMSSGLGLTINHATFVCTRVNEPLMTSVAGNLKNAVMTVVGAIMFPDFKFSMANAGGLALSMAGAVWYAIRSALKVRANAIKLSQSQQQLGGGKSRGMHSRKTSEPIDDVPFILDIPKENDALLHKANGIKG